MITFVDFQKAFDSVTFRFLESTLEVFEFGPNYMKWIIILLSGYIAGNVVDGNTSERRGDCMLIL